jgi:hypothetical protein
MLDLANLAWLAVLMSASFYWWRAYGMKEIALASTRRYCKKMDLDLLDDTVVLRAYWFKRDEGGRLRMWRSFNFEFTSTGEERYLGRIILLGDRVETIQLQAHKLN